MKTVRFTSILMVSLFAMTTGVVLADAALASEASGSEGGACAVKAAPDGSKPASLSDAELRSKLEAAGYKEVRSLSREDGCVEAKGADRDGKRFEVYLHPVTGEIVSKR